MNDSSDFKFRTSYALTPFLQAVLESTYSSYKTTGAKKTRKIVGFLVKKCLLVF